MAANNKSNGDYEVELSEQHKAIVTYLRCKFRQFIESQNCDFDSKGDSIPFFKEKTKKSLIHFFDVICNSFGRSYKELNIEKKLGDPAETSRYVKRLNCFLRNFSCDNGIDTEHPIQLFSYHQGPDKIYQTNFHFACAITGNTTKNRIYSTNNITLSEARRRGKGKTQDASQTVEQSQAYLNDNAIEQSWFQLRENMSQLGSASVYGEGMLSELFVEPNSNISLQCEPAEPEISGPAIQILSDYEYGDKPALLFGEFGSGKSSLLKMFAAKLAHSDATLYPVYIPLGEILIYSTSSLIDAIKKYLGVKYNIHDFDESISNRPLCWLLDGFDELNLYSEDDKWIIDRYREIEQIATKKNNRVIVSSRPILFLGNLDNIPRHTPRIDIASFSDDKIATWISLWKKLPKYKNSQLSLEGLKKRYLIDVARNPMILFMVATMFDQELREERSYLRSEIYQFFIDSTEKGKHVKDKDAQYVSSRRRPNYREILQEIAFIIFRYGSTGLISRENLRKYLPETGAVEEVINDRKLRPILVGHFFQETVDSDNRKYIEFSHQSFREYLVVENVIRMLINSTEKTFDAYEWHKLCCMMLTPAKLGFLCERLCLLKGNIRKKIFETFSRFLANPGGIEKEFLPSDSGDFRTNSEIFKALHFTSTMRRVLSCYICSIIASYSSHEFRKTLEFASDKSFIMRIFHACYSYPLNSTIVKAWNVLLNELPGAIWGPNLNWNGFEINSDHFHDIAILSPDARNITINSRFVANIFSDLQDHTILSLGGEYIGKCIFRGGTIVLTNSNCRFHECIFVNCQIMNIGNKTDIDGDDCCFHNTSMVNLSVPAKPRNIGGIISKNIDMAVKSLVEYSENIGCSCMVPWGDIVIDKIPDFERIVFGIKEDEQSMLRFSNICRTIAMSSENT